jgi:hypothetical protein
MKALARAADFGGNSWVAEKALTTQWGAGGETDLKSS